MIKKIQLWNFSWHYNRSKVGYVGGMVADTGNKFEYNTGSKMVGAVMIHNSWKDKGISNDNL